MKRAVALQLGILTILLLGGIWLFYFSPGNSHTTIGMTGARRALEFFASARSYPASDIPKAGMADAYKLMQRQKTEMRLSKNRHSLDLEPWRAIGPHNLGGRTLALALNPQNSNTLFAGSASGGLWRSYTGGRGPLTWHRIATGFPVLAVSSIAIVPGDSSTIYIGTGEMYGNPISHPGVLGGRLNRGSYGIGILKSTDNGLTWQKSLDWLYEQRRAVQMIRLNPLRPASLWAATTEGTFRSGDAGQSWQQAHDVIMATDLVIDAQDTNIVVVGCGGMGSAGHGIYRTADGGQNWQKVVIPTVTSFEGKVRLAAPANVGGVIYASIGKHNGTIDFSQSFGTWLARSDDSGKTWEIVSTLDYAALQGWYSHDVAVHPFDPNIIWTAGQPFVPFFSNNGGANLASASDWNLLEPATSQGLEPSWADYHHIIFDTSNPDLIYFANDGGIFMSNDGGQTLQNCNDGYQSTQFYNGTSSSLSDSLFSIGGLQDNGTAIYRGNSFWQRPFGADGGWTALNQHNNDSIYYSWQFLNIIRSRDRGQNDAAAIRPPVTDAMTNFIAPFVLSPADNSTLYAGSIYVHKRKEFVDTAWQITNDGQPLASESNPAIAMAASHQNVAVVYVVTSPSADLRAQIFKTIDGGDSWSEVTGDLPDRFLTDLVIDANDDNALLVTLGGFGTSHLYQSLDGGSSWEDIGSGLPDVPTWAAIYDPDFPEQIFVGNDLGIYFTQDDGQSWLPYMMGLTDAVMAMDFSIAGSNRILRVATHGNGFFETHLPAPVAAGVSAFEPVPTDMVLEQNYPNPFNPETRIRFHLAQAGHVELVVFNLAGQHVNTLISGFRRQGWQQVVWNGQDAHGENVASGIYLYQLRAANRSRTQKMALVR